MSDRLHQGQVAGTHWNPGQYLKFSDHRARPALELLDRMPLERPKVIYDLGCGAGHMARLMAERWPAATVYGLDNSAEMLDKAASEPSRVNWVEADVRTWTPELSPDLIYSNATLQWVDSHQELFPRLLSHVTPGGCLAVQMPLSWSMPSHRLMRETLANGGPGNTSIGDAVLRAAVARKWVDDMEVYYDLLSTYTSHLDIWATEYLQVLAGKDPVLEWVKSTGLRPILHGLNDAERETFLSAYRQRLRQTYPTRANGHTLYPFRRLFIIALRSAQ